MTERDDGPVSIVVDMEEEDEELEVEETEPPIHSKLGRFVSRFLPFLTKECSFRERHWRWSRFCYCGFAQRLPDWHGGVLDLRSNQELQPCAACFEDHSWVNHQWHLTQEEEAILTSWRGYRAEVLDVLGKQTPYRYEIVVDLNGTKLPLMSRVKGFADSGPRGFFAGTKRGSNEPN